MPPLTANFEATPCLIIINARIHAQSFIGYDLIALQLFRPASSKPGYPASSLFSLLPSRFSLSLSLFTRPDLSSPGWRSISSGELWFMASRCLERFVMAVSSKNDCHGAQRQASQLETLSAFYAQAFNNKVVRENRWQIAGFWRLSFFRGPSLDLRSWGGGIISGQGNCSLLRITNSHPPEKIVLRN